MADFVRGGGGVGLRRGRFLALNNVFAVKSAFSLRGSEMESSRMCRIRLYAANRERGDIFTRGTAEIRSYIHGVYIELYILCLY